MAIGPDRVQVIVVESAGLGGDGADETDYPHPLSPQEDALEACGIYFQDASNRDENVWIERHGGSMRFRDQNVTTPVSLTTLLSAEVMVFADGTIVVDDITGDLMILG